MFLYVLLPVHYFLMNLISRLGAQEGEHCLKIFQSLFEANCEEGKFCPFSHSLHFSNYLFLAITQFFKLS
jgi:hypothetical protein